MTGVPLKDVHDRLGDDGAALAVPPPQASTTTLAQPQRWFTSWATGTGGNPGPVVNEFTALNYAALYSCVSLIARTIASLPLKVYRRLPGGGGQEDAPERAEYGLLQNEFNPNTSAMVGRETGLAHYLVWGNSFTQVVRTRGGDAVRLQPLGPDIVEVRTDRGGGLVYDVYDRATNQVAHTLGREEVLHVPGLSFDALVGQSPVRTNRTTIAGGMGQDREAARFVARGIRPPGAIKFPPGKSFADQQQADLFRDGFRKLHAGEDGASNVIILEDGAEWQDIGIDPESAQLLESRKFSRGEVAGLYHVPPHLIGDTEKSTSWGTGIEEQTLGFLVYCLLPHLRRVEQEYNRKLFRAAPEFFCEHSLAGLLRGDTTKQAQAIQIYVNLGLLAVNEARRLLGWNPVPGGDVRYFPLNMGRIDAAGRELPPPAGAKPPAGDPVPPPPDQSARMAGPLRRGIVAAARRCLKREAAEAVKAAAKPATFVAWVETFYGRHVEMVADHCGPPAEAWAVAFGGPADYPTRHVERSRSELLAAADGDPAGFADRVGRLAERWQAERLGDVAAEFQPGA